MGAKPTYYLREICNLPVDDDSEKSNRLIESLFRLYDTDCSGYLEENQATSFFNTIYLYFIHVPRTLKGNQQELVKSWVKYFDDDRDRRVSFGEFKSKIRKFLKSDPNELVVPDFKEEVMIMYSVELNNLFNTAYFANDDNADAIVKIKYRSIEWSTLPLKDKRNPVWFPNLTFTPKKDEEPLFFEILDHYPSFATNVEGAALGKAGPLYNSGIFGTNKVIGNFKITPEQIEKQKELSDNTYEDNIELIFEGEIELERSVKEKGAKSAIQLYEADKKVQDEDDKKYGSLESAKPRYRIAILFQTRDRPYAYTPQNYLLNIFNTLFLNAALLNYPNDVTAAHVKPPREGTLVPTIVSYTNTIKIAVEDQSNPVQKLDKATKQAAKFMRMLPWVESPAWTREQGQENTGLKYGHSLPIPPEKEWTLSNLTSDETLTRFFFQGVAATTTVRKEDRSGFYADFDSLLKYSAKRGMVPYHGKIFFDNLGKVERIEYNNGKPNRISRPGSLDWEYAKYVVRTSAMMAVTLEHHLVHSHLVWSNNVAAAALGCLDGSHEVRRLLHIHTYRAMYINEASILLLIPEGGALDRVGGWEFPTLQKALDDMFIGYKFKTFPEFIKENGMHDAPKELYPVYQDGVEFFDIVYNYIRKYLKLFYKGDIEDKQLNNFWDRLRGVIKGIPHDLTVETLSLVLTQYVFQVSGWHSQVGNVVATSRDPAFAGNAIWEGEAMARPQSFYLQAGIGVGTCGIMPMMTDDWSHLLPKEERVQDVYNEFRSNLKKLGKTIKGRNLSRRWNYSNFIPSLIETSVAV